MSEPASKRQKSNTGLGISTCREFSSTADDQSTITQNAQQELAFRPYDLSKKIYFETGGAEGPVNQIEMFDPADPTQQTWSPFFPQSLSNPLAGISPYDFDPAGTSLAIKPSSDQVEGNSAISNGIQTKLIMPSQGISTWRMTEGVCKAVCGGHYTDFMSKDVGKLSLDTFLFALKNVPVAIGPAHEFKVVDLMRTYVCCDGLIRVSQFFDIGELHETQYAHQKWLDDGCLGPDPKGNRELETLQGAIMCLFENFELGQVPTYKQLTASIAATYLNKNLALAVLGTKEEFDAFVDHLGGLCKLLNYGQVEIR